jgi:hypothetical protein
MFPNYLYQLFVLENDFIYHEDYKNRTYFFSCLVQPLKKVSH